MKRILAVGVVLFAMQLFGAVVSGPAFENLPPNVFFYENDPVPVPATAATLITGDIWLEEMTLSNTTSSDVTCTVNDRQTTPRALFNNVVRPGISIFPFKARKMPGGVTWNCADGTSVIGFIRGKRLGQ